jgi:PEGA domain-containing protein
MSRPRSNERRAAALALLVAFFVTSPGHAQPVPAPPVTDRKERAAAALERGVALYRQGAFDAALAEFLASRAAYPARGNTLNAALCLAKLGRADEALDMFETLLREVSPLAPREKELVEKQVRELRRRVGRVEVRILEPGATVVIGGRERGTTPLSAPIRVAVGSHLVRIFKQGFIPQETLVDVASEQQVAVEGRLEPLVAAGQLTVTTTDGAVAEVVLDNIPVGPTPWQGRVQTGTHTIRLRGEGELGTRPLVAEVRADDVTPLVLELVRLDCPILIAPLPAGARLAIDGVDVGLGAWAGALDCGAHRIEVAASGFLTVDRTVQLERSGPREIAVELDRDPDSAEWHEANPGRITVEVFGAPLLSPALGGDAGAGCDLSCSSPPPLGVIVSAGAGYQLGLGIGFGVEVGFLQLRQSMQERSITVSQVPNAAPINGFIDDERTLRSALVGAATWFRRGEPWSFVAHLGAGAALGTLATRRESTVEGDAVALADQSTAANYFYLSARLGVGYQPSEQLEVSLAFQAAVLFALTQPSWEQDAEAFNARAGFLSYPTESLTGEGIWLLSPGVAATLSFL